ncbi:MAG: HAMP domain-containing sensor histidine kinase [Bacteroidales bacterium]
MSKKLLILIIILAALALAGIIYAQLYYIRIAFEQNEIRFDQKVNDALQAFVDKLEQKQTVEIIHAQANRLKQRSIQTRIAPPPPHDDPVVFEFNDSMLNKMVFISEMQNATVDIRLADSNVYIKNGHKIQNYHTIKTIRKTDGTAIVQQSWTNGTDSIVFIDPNTFSSKFNFNVDTTEVFVVNKEKFRTKSDRFKNLIRRMEYDNKEQDLMLKRELDSTTVDSLLSVAFKEKNVELPYEYKVQKGPLHPGKKTSSHGFDSLTNQKKYTIGLFPHDIIPKPEQLVVYFPNRQDHLLKSLSILLPSSLFFSLIVIVAFSVTIMMVIKQKKISDIKSDFINNMTHEFKTPIATISLAADSIINPKVIDDRSKIEHFTRIIKEENKRMNQQVERILQMSLLERSEMDLNLQLLNINDLVETAVGKISMQIAKFNASLKLELNCTNDKARVDEIHFINVIHNLIDNALKYSNENPEIMISTCNTSNGIVLSVEDKGIGLTKEAQSKIFEKFYRVSKGNIHNIKGFGLGLSYVKAIVEAMDGKISVKSELNKGSRFDIFLSQKNHENGKQV